MSGLAATTLVAALLVVEPAAGGRARAVAATVEDQADAQSRAEAPGGPAASAGARAKPSTDGQRAGTPPVHRDERAALDRVYELLARREFAQARLELQPIVLAVQEKIRAASSSKATPEAEAALRLRVGEVVFLQGQVEARLGRKQDALDLLGQADGYGFPPLDSPRMALAAQCLMELEEPALAAQAWREVVKASPAKRDARLALGISLYSAGQLDEAAVELEAVLARSPATPQAGFYLGSLRLDQGRVEEARPLLERELARDPACSGCLARLAHAAYLSGDDAKCEALLARASSLDASGLETNFVYGLLFNRAGRFDRAIRHLTLVVEKVPNHGRAQYQLALAYQRSGQPEKAREHREVYDRLLAAQRARANGVRVGGE